MLYPATNSRFLAAVRRLKDRERRKREQTRKARRQLRGMAQLASK